MFDRVHEYVEKIGEKVATYFGDYTPKGVTKTPDRNKVRMMIDHHTLSSLLPYERC
jgi:hypothetical protein